MKAANLPENEKERLEELYSYDILDTAYEEAFNQIVQLASAISDSPISTITMVDVSRQWFKAKVGIEDAEGDRDISFCGHAILHTEIMEIADALQDERFFDNPLVTGNPNIRFYAGMPLITKKGLSLGTLCVIDSKPKSLTETQKFMLKVLANQAMQLLELHKKHAEVANLVKTQQKILSIVSHDVRNPLGAIKSILELKNDDIISAEEFDEMLEVASKQIDSTIDMIANLVEWGRMQINVKKLVKKDVDFPAIVQHCFDMVHAASTLKNNRLVLNSQCNTIHTDPDALKFIIRNLVTNANKYTENGTITVSSFTQHDKTLIQVADTGVGMTEEKRKSLFENPKNFSEPGTQNEPGSGLGLILIKEFLDKIHAEISIESEPGKGTKVNILI
ncbi:GAF domain-containing sensor histidine kinase [Foetidibacter luteolus]|uniref:GAF domain-containing sensor histidine kinase n=1 Tax=Foetidibacter luteolus TaxID=2608880 RepID=UPI00129A43F4|nr:GAF domain-containing sensor histidine kinase [Foetidibacter luteolus]